MPASKHIGPITVEVGPGRPAEDGRLGLSPTYRNILGVDEMPKSVDGATTLLEIFEAAVAKYPDRPCLGWRPILSDGSAGPYKFLTYAQTHQKARELASALAQVGVKPGSKVGVYGANSVNWMLAIRAADVLSAAIVPIYDSLGESAVEYIIKHSEVTVALIEPSKLAHFAAIAPHLSSGVKTVVMMADVTDTAPLEAIRAAGIKVYSWDEFMSLGASREVKVVAPKAEDLACIMYTSGTTGTPKGALILQRNLVSAVAGSRITIEKQAKLGLGPEDAVLSFLPLAHVYGRVMEEVMLSLGSRIGYWRGNVKLLMDDMATLKPTLLVAVPRILERVCDAVEAKLHKGPAAARVAFHAAFSYKLFLLRRGLSHWASGLLVDQLIFRKVHLATGGRVRFIISGGAPLAAHVEDFCNVCLAPVLQGYGLTETCAASFIILPDPRLSHTVGPPLAPTEFRLESVPELKYDATEDPPKGEIHIRGPMVFSGYYKDQQKTDEALDSEGWFRTGDIGTLTRHGCLKIIDRKKNIFKLAQGEYIAVEYLEGHYSRSEIIEQVWVYGNSHESALVAVVVPKPEWLEKYQGPADEAARKAMLDELARVGKEAKLKGFEMIRAVLLETQEFTTENDLMTPSMKLKRPQLQRKYQKELDDMYAKLKAK